MSNRIFLYKIVENQAFFGAGLITLSCALQYCESMNFKLQMSEEDGWCLVPKGKKQNWYYYFEPIEKLEDLTGKTIEYFKINHITTTIKDEKGVIIGKEPNFSVFPSEFVNLHEYKRHLIRKIYKPKPWVLDNIKKRISNLKLPEHYYAIHVRRTDKIGNEGQFHKLDEYLKPIYYKWMSTNRDHKSMKYNHKPTVYVSTDENCENFYKELGTSIYGHLFNIILDHTEPRYSNGYVPNSQQIVYMNNLAEEETLTAFKNIEILINSDFMVGSRESFFFIIAILLGSNEYYSIAENYSCPMRDGLLPTNKESI